jgi:hypothetical protein
MPPGASPSAVSMKPGLAHVMGFGCGMVRRHRARERRSQLLTRYRARFTTAETGWT